MLLFLVDNGIQYPRRTYLLPGRTDSSGVHRSQWMQFSRQCMCTTSVLSLITGYVWYTALFPGFPPLVDYF